MKKTFLWLTSSLLTIHLILPSVQAQEIPEGLPLVSMPSFLPTALGGKALTRTSYDNANRDFLLGPKLYAGIALGQSKQGDICNDPFFDGTCDDTSMNWKVYGGTRINPLFGAELTYNKLGEASLSGQTNGADAYIKNDISTYSVSAMGYMPVTPQIEAFAKGGIAFWERDSEKSGKGVQVATEDDGKSPLLGLGAQYRLTKNLHVRGEWEHFFNMGSDSSFETDADNYSIGIVYSTP